MEKVSAHTSQTRIHDHMSHVMCEWRIYFCCLIEMGGGSHVNILCSTQRPVARAA